MNGYGYSFSKYLCEKPSEDVGGVQVLAPFPERQTLTELPRYLFECTTSILSTMQDGETSARTPKAISFISAIVYW